VHLALEQRLPGNVDRVLDALLDPAFVASMGSLPNLAAPEVRSQERTGDVVVQRLHYRFTGALPSAVTRVVDPGKLTWVLETTFELARRSASFRILPDHYASKLRCDGRIVFIDDGDHARRQVDADLRVTVPFVGRAVERAIASGLREHLDREADLLRDWLEVKP